MAREHMHVGWWMAVMAVSSLALAGCTDESGPEQAEATLAPAEPAPPPRTVLLEQTFTGFLPLDGNVRALHDFEVPSGADEVQVVYTSDHVGIFRAWVSVWDEDGKRMDSVDDCEPGTPGAAVDRCEMAASGDIPAEPWTIQVFWQLGQAIEQYTIDVKVLGVTVSPTDPRSSPPE